MRELLRVTRRASRFGGSVRLSKSPHAPESMREPPPPPCPPRVVSIVEPTATELKRRRDGGGPASRASHGPLAPSSAPAGPWSHDAELSLPESAPPPDSRTSPAGARSGLRAGNLSRSVSRSVSSTGAVAAANDGPDAHRAERSVDTYRFRESTESTLTKRREGLRTQDPALEPVERLLRELSPKEMQPAPNESSKHLKYRLMAAEELLDRYEDVLKTEVQKRAVRFSNASMGSMAEDLTRGLTTEDVNELRTLCRTDTPQPSISLLGRCIATLLSADAVGEAERKGRAGSQGVAGSLLAWDGARNLLMRADFRQRLLKFDPRSLLTAPHLVNAVRDKVDTSITAATPMHASVRLRGASGEALKPSAAGGSSARRASGGGDDLNGSGAAASPRAAAHRGASPRRRPPGASQQRGSGNAGGGGPVTGSLVGASDSEPLATLATDMDAQDGALTYEDAKFVSRAATSFIVWMARLFEALRSLESEWHAATKACAQAEKNIDAARAQVEEVRAKLMATLRLERERQADLAAVTEKRVALRKLTAQLPTELTTVDMLLIPARGQPNVFFQHAHAPSEVVGLHTAAVNFRQMPREIKFYIHLKHINVPYPFPRHLASDATVRSCSCIVHVSPLETSPAALLSH